MNSISQLQTLQDHCIEVCNRLLRGEISAVESYARVIETSAGTPVIGELRRIRSEHVSAVRQLIANVMEMGGKPETDPEARWNFSRIIPETANPPGRKSALESLQRGEESVRRDYQDALLDDEVMVDCKLLIREELLPQVIRHVATLEKLEQAA